MTEVDYGPLNVLLRARETELLDDKFYDQLLTAKNLDEALKYLETTPYNFIQDGQNIDEELRDYLSQLYKEIFEITPNIEAVEFSALEYTYHNLKVLFKDYYSDKNLKYLTIDIGRFSVQEMESAIKTGNKSTLTLPYIEVIKEAQDYYANYQNLNHLDVILDFYYLTHLDYLAKKINSPLIIELVKEHIDLNTLVIVQRLLKLNKPVSWVNGMVPDLGNIPISHFIKVAKQGSEGLNMMMQESLYREALADIRDNNGVLDSNDIEKMIDNRQMDIYKKAKLEAFGPLPVLAYLFAKKVEVKNLRIILSGIVNGLAKEKIKKLLRNPY
ncbi:V-type ATPase subunit [Ignavigranum ruoffiae]|uniref:V-type ATPase subunit n=1 Tax=Ignavigranum ruoffiae TaxID=89093 RepID=UPI0024AD27D1|nr:V-type ATPase subunit [Ignavigranum ruoffiae]